MFEIIFEIFLHLIPEYFDDKVSRFIENKKVCRVIAQILTILACIIALAIILAILLGILSLISFLGGDGLIDWLVIR